MRLTMNPDDLITKLRKPVTSMGLGLGDALVLAELQAGIFLHLTGIVMPPVPESIVSELPFIEVRRITPSLVAGAAHFSRGRWLIALNGADIPARQRFTLMHEFKHVLDDPYPDLYRGESGMTSSHIAERVCDFFAANVLMPKAWVQEGTAGRFPDIRALAAWFKVSLQAMQYRVSSLGLGLKPVRCWPAHHERRRDVESSSR